MTFMVFSDALSVGLCGVLMQNERFIKYVCRQLKVHWNNYKYKYILVKQTNMHTQ